MLVGSTEDALKATTPPYRTYP